MIREGVYFSNICMSETRYVKFRSSSLFINVVLHHNTLMLCTTDMIYISTYLLLYLLTRTF